MRIFFLFNGRYPSEKAAALFLQEEAESFATLGNDVTVIVPRRFGRSVAASTGSRVRVVYTFTIDLVPLGILRSLFFRFSLLCFAWSSFVYLLFVARKGDLIIGYESLPLLLATYVFPNTCYELHDYPERNQWLFHALFARVKHVLVTNRWKEEQLHTDFSQTKGKTFVEQNAVDTSVFVSVSKREARNALGIPEDERAVVYTGHLYAWKGVDTLAKAAQYIVGTIYVVGGTDADIERFKDMWGQVRNMRIVGRRPHEEMPRWQKAADVLVLPNTGKEEISAHYTSPMKLFEYMASGTPIVASNLPSIAEIAGDGRATLVEPDNAKALADGVISVLQHGAATESAAARTWVEDHTWQKRVQRILSIVHR